MATKDTSVKDQVQHLRTLIDAALEKIAKDQGLPKLKLGNGTYNSEGGNFTFKLDGILSGGLGKEESAYDANYHYLGLPARGTEFKAGTRTYTTWGLKSRGGKVICVEKSDGKKYLVDMDKVQRLTGMTAETAKAKLTQVADGSLLVAPNSPTVADGMVAGFIATPKA